MNVKPLDVDALLKCNADMEKQLENLQNAMKKKTKQLEHAMGVCRCAATQEKYEFHVINKHFLISHWLTVKQVMLNYACLQYHNNSISVFFNISSCIGGTKSNEGFLFGLYGVFV